MNQGQKGRIYVSLNSVISVLFSLIALFGLGTFFGSYFYNYYHKRPEGWIDLVNLSNSFTSYLLIGSILGTFLLLGFFIWRTVWTLNHPTIINVTIEYIDENGRPMSVTRMVPADEFNKEDYKKKVKKVGKRFDKLSDLDKQYPKHVSIPTTDGLTLATLCARFRSFCASIPDRPLYYSMADIRRFVASMGVSKIMILQGMSGTGKTSLPFAWGRFTGVQTTVVPVQPMWKERSDLIGYYNEFTGKFNEQEILRVIYEANKKDAVYLIVLDEVNIARVEYYFAEFLSLLEIPTAEGRKLEVISSKNDKDPKGLVDGNVMLPDNVWFIGTANNDDSTFAISDKVYDRAMIMNLDYRCDAFIAEGESAGITISAPYLNALFKSAKSEFKLTNRGRARIKEVDSFMKDAFGVTFGNRIRRQIDEYVPVYIACGGTELEALDDIIAKKVLRKLESQNPVYVKSRAEELISKLNEAFGEGMCPVCEAYIRKLANNA